MSLYACDYCMRALFDGIWITFGANTLPLSQGWARISLLISFSGRLCWCSAFGRSVTQLKESRFCTCVSNIYTQILQTARTKKFIGKKNWFCFIYKPMDNRKNDFKYFIRESWIISSIQRFKFISWNSSISRQWTLIFLLKHIFPSLKKFIISKICHHLGCRLCALCGQITSNRFLLLFFNVSRVE